MRTALRELRLARVKMRLMVAMLRLQLAGDRSTLLDFAGMVFALCHGPVGMWLGLAASFVTAFIFHYRGSGGADGAAESLHFSHYEYVQYDMATMNPTRNLNLSLIEEECSGSAFAWLPPTEGCMAVVAPTMDLNLPNDKKECSGSAFAWFLAMMAGPRTHSNYMAVGAAVLLEHSGGALAQPVDALGGQPPFWYVNAHSSGVNLSGSMRLHPAASWGACFV